MWTVNWPSSIICRNIFCTSGCAFQFHLKEGLNKDCDVLSVIVPPHDRRSSRWTDNFRYGVFPLGYHIESYHNFEPNNSRQRFRSVLPTSWSDEHKWTDWTVFRFKSSTTSSDSFRHLIDRFILADNEYSDSSEFFICVCSSDCSFVTGMPVSSDDKRISDKQHPLPACHPPQTSVVFLAEVPISGVQPLVFLFCRCNFSSQFFPASAIESVLLALARFNLEPTSSIKSIVYPVRNDSEYIHKSQMLLQLRLNSWLHGIFHSGLIPLRINTDSPVSVSTIIGADVPVLRLSRFDDTLSVLLHR